MRLLHSIVNKTHKAWFWGTILGGNGRILTPHPHTIDGYWVHAYEIDRQAPELPPVPEGIQMTYGNAHYAAWSYRRYFVPWEVRSWNRERMVTPLCGQLPTRSLRPRMFNVSAHMLRYNTNIHMCERCVMLASERGIQITYLETLNLQDPFTIMGTQRRPYEIDPVSGQ